MNDSHAVVAAGHSASNKRKAWWARRKRAERAVESSAWSGTCVHVCVAVTITVLQPTFITAAVYDWASLIWLEMVTW